MPLTFFLELSCQEHISYIICGMVTSLDFLGCNLSPISEKRDFPVYHVQRRVKTIWQWFRAYFKAALRTVVPILKPEANT